MFEENEVETDMRRGKSNIFVHNQFMSWMHEEKEKRSIFV